MGSAVAVAEFPDDDSNADLTELIHRAGEGDRAAADQLWLRIYQELRKLAAYHMRAEPQDHTLQPTALVNEIWMRMSASTPAIQDRTHLFALISQAMRHLLVDHARARLADKRSTPLPPVFVVKVADEVLLAVDAALEKLKRLSPRAAQVVDMRFVLGMTEGEIAEMLNLSERTVKRDWRFAKAWLKNEIEGFA